MQFGAETVTPSKDKMQHLVKKFVFDICIEVPVTVTITANMLKRVLVKLNNFSMVMGYDVC